MDTPSPLALASMFLAAPGWAGVGIAAPSERMREAAALELGVIIAERVEYPVEVPPDWCRGAYRVYPGGRRTNSLPDLRAAHFATVVKTDSQVSFT